MLVKQISVFMENKTGRLSDICDLLAKNNINLAAVTLADSTDFGILRALTNDIDKSVKVLNEAGFVTRVNELLAVDVENAPGGLAKVLNVLEENMIGVNYLYSFADENQRAVMLIKVDDANKTIKLLNDNGFKLIDHPLA